MKECQECSKRFQVAKIGRVPRFCRECRVRRATRGYKHGSWSLSHFATVMRLRLDAVKGLVATGELKMDEDGRIPVRSMLAYLDRSEGKTSPVTT